MDVEVRQCQKPHAADLVESPEAKLAVLVAVMDVAIDEVVQDTRSEGLPRFPVDVFVDESMGLGELEVGWIFNQMHVRKKESGRRSVDYFVAAHNFGEVPPVQKFVVQAFDVYGLVEPDEVELCPFGDNDVSVDHLLMVQRADVAFSPSVPKLFVD